MDQSGSITLFSLQLLLQQDPRRGPDRQNWGTSEREPSSSHIRDARLPWFTVRGLKKQSGKGMTGEIRDKACGG